MVEEKENFPLYIYIFFFQEKSVAGKKMLGGGNKICPTTLTYLFPLRDKPNLFAKGAVR